MTAVQYLTLAEVAKQLRTSVQTVRYWIYLGKLPSYKPGRSVLIRATDLEAFVQASEQGAKQAAKAKADRKRSL